MESDDENVLDYAGPKRIPIIRGGTRAVDTQWIVLLWGPPKAGKTEFAATAPKDKLYINVDPGGFETVRARSDCHLLDVSGWGNEEFFKYMESDNPLGLDQFLPHHPEVGTLVVDSTTSIYDRCTEQAVFVDRAGLSTKFTPTIAEPGLSAYGARTTHLARIIRGFTRLAKRHNRHLIFTAHEDVPDKDKKGNIISIGIMLSARAINNSSTQVSDIWHLRNIDSTRVLSFAPRAKREPMGSRVFYTTRGEDHVNLTYDPREPLEGQAHTISNWYSQWVDGGYKKMPVPK